MYFKISAGPLSHAFSDGAALVLTFLGALAHTDKSVYMYIFIISSDSDQLVTRRPYTVMDLPCVICFPNLIGYFD